LALTGLGFFFALGVKGLGGVLSIRARTASRELSGALLEDMRQELQGYRALTGLEPDQLIVVGFVTIAWNLLERGIEVLIALTAEWKDPIGDFVTADMGNVTKAQLLANLITHRITDERLREESRSVLAFFDELRNRRNNLIHATMDWDTADENKEERPAHTKRSAKAGKGAVIKARIDCDLPALRQLGKDIELCYEAWREIYFKMHQFNYFHRHPKPGDDAATLAHYLHEIGPGTYENIAQTQIRLKALRSQSGGQCNTQPQRPPSQRKPKARD